MIFLFIYILIVIYLIIGDIKKNSIPKVIWTYWDGDPPTLVKKCIDTWSQKNPDYKINILNKDNTSHLSHLRHGSTPNRYSDFVRLDYLSKYGGVWIDASTVINESLDWIHHSDKDFVGYYIDGFTIKKEWPVVESWFFACPKNSKFVNDWKTEFFRMENFETVDQYLEDVKSKGVDFSKINGPDYLTIHVSAQKCIQSGTRYDLELIQAESDAYKYLKDVDWDSRNAVNIFCNGEARNQKIVKLRGIERIYINDDCKELKF